MRRFFTKQLNKYNDWCYYKPLKSSVINTFFIMTTGDFLIQYVEFRQKKEKQIIKENENFHKNIDWKRNMILSSYAIIFLGPTFFLWYVKILPKLAPIDFTCEKKQILGQLFKKLLYEETIMSWTFILSFMCWATYFETFSVQKIIEKIKKDSLNLYKQDLSFWPFVQFMNFYFVPIHFQGLLTNFICIFWCGYCSYIQYQ